MTAYASLPSGIRSFTGRNNRMTNQKIMLNDVVIMRPLAIFLLVVWHSFIIYAGGWKEPVNFQPVETYWWLAKFSYAFMLELFVFISGYVFSLSLQKRNYKFSQLVVSKLKRLIVPSILFSLIYFFMFYDLSQFTIASFVLDILSGCGHMWFLPMLFWVTLLGYAIDKIEISEMVKMLLVLCLPALSILPVPFRIGSALYYIPFFYVGMIVFRKKSSIIDRFSNSLNTSILWGGVFAVAFVLGTLLIRDILPQYKAISESFIAKGMIIELSTYAKLIYSALGVFFTYIFVNYLLKKTDVGVPNWMSHFNKMCFGMYLFQQFILQVLYYKTSLPVLVGSYWLPWVGLSVTLIISYILTMLSLKTKIGQLLM